MTAISAPLPSISELTVLVAGLIKEVELLLGGLFGLYLVFFIISAINRKKERRVLVDIRSELRRLNHNLDLGKPHSRGKLRKRKKIKKR
jgi:hypothetical protein